MIAKIFIDMHVKCVIKAIFRDINRSTSIDKREQMLELSVSNRYQVHVVVTHDGI